MVCESRPSFNDKMDTPAPVRIQWRTRPLDPPKWYLSLLPIGHPFRNHSERHAVRRSSIRRSVEHSNFDGPIAVHAIILLRTRRIEPVGKGSGHCGGRNLRPESSDVYECRRYGNTVDADDRVPHEPDTFDRHFEIRAAFDRNMGGDRADLRLGSLRSAE